MKPLPYFTARFKINKVQFLPTLRSHKQSSRGGIPDGGEIVKLSCDGSYDFYFGCATGSKYSEEETFLTAKLQETHWYEECITIYSHNSSRSVQSFLSICLWCVRSTLTVEEAVAKLGVILRDVEAPEEDEDDVKDTEGGDRGTEKESGMVKRMRKYPYTIVETIKVTE